MKDPKPTNDAPDLAAEREARYFAGYVALPDDDEDFRAIDRLAVETLRSLEE